MREKRHRSHLILRLHHRLVCTIPVLCSVLCCRVCARLLPNRDLWSWEYGGTSTPDTNNKGGCSIGFGATIVPGTTRCSPQAEQKQVPALYKWLCVIALSPTLVNHFHCGMRLFCPRWAEAGWRHVFVIRIQPLLSSDDDDTAEVKIELMA